MAAWISPAEAMDLVYDDPARAGPDADFGFAILWRASNKRSTTSSTADLARAKLQPRRPTPAQLRTAGDGWAVTAHDYRLCLAPGVADVAGPAELFADYDRAVAANQNMMAVVQTLRFDRDMPRHDMMEATSMYASICLRPKHLSSLIVQHMPSDARSARDPHLHVITPILTHHLSGWGRGHPVFDDPPAAMHRAFEADWHRFRAALDRAGA